MSAARAWILHWSTFSSLSSLWLALGFPSPPYCFTTPATPWVCSIPISSLHLSSGISQTNPNCQPSPQLRPTVPCFFPNGVKFSFPRSVSEHSPSSASVASPGTPGQAHLKDLELHPGMVRTELKCSCLA